jgi:hypothetical protein
MESKRTRKGQDEIYELEWNQNHNFMLQEDLPAGNIPALL